MKSFTAIMEEVLQTPNVDQARDHRMSAGVFLPLDDAPLAKASDAAARTQALYREQMEDGEPDATAIDGPLTRSPMPAANPQADLEALIPQVNDARSHAELTALRRAFAQRHHPDRAPENLVEDSARAMREANALIDAAALRLG